ncbi:signal peptidase I [candidate division TM6 bacterium RIFCSPHIGHO2_12_FULL_32_22]|nr:MAG: signal peptidase I [candidate division TM6 bacterium RIFCSPHIGHO2_12_FULL_32_22]
MKKVVKWIRKPNKTFSEQVIEVVFVVIPIAFIIRTFGYGLYQVPTGSMETTLLVGERFVADKFTIWFSSPKRGDIISFNQPDFKYSDNKILALIQKYVWAPGGYAPENWTKRVIGIPGDHVKGVVEEGKPVIYLKKKGESEFQKLDEPYVNKFPIMYLYDRNNPRAIHYYSYDPSCSYLGQPFYTMQETVVRLSATYASRYGIPAVLYPYTALRDLGNSHENSLDSYDVELGDNQYWALGDNRLGSRDSRFWGPLDGSQIHGKIIYRIWSMDTQESWMAIDLIKNPIGFWDKVRWARCFEFVG